MAGLTTLEGPATEARANAQGPPPPPGVGWAGLGRSGGQFLHHTWALAIRVFENAQLLQTSSTMFAPQLGSGDSGVRKCATVANLIDNFAPRVGSGDSGVRKRATISNSMFKCAQRLGSGDSGVRKCASVANFIDNLAPR